MVGTYNWLKKLRSFKRDESGVTIIIVALSLAVFLGFAGLVTSVGSIMIARNELQNAADAAALSGAGQLWYNNISRTPNWSVAQTAASTNAPNNKSGGITLVNYEVQTGYWNLYRTPIGLQPSSITPGAYDVAAVQVTVQRAAGQNGGPVNTFFGSFIGKSTVNVKATATAVSGTPNSVKPGTLLPVAIARVAADQQSSYNDIHHLIRIGSSYHYPTSIAGQWTSFTTDANDVSTFRDLLANGNPSPISIGTSIWIEPGTKTTLYSFVPVGVDVVLPVVKGNITTHSAMPVCGFIGFHITASEGGCGQYIEGYFLNSIEISGTPGGGPTYGVYAPPGLVQ